MPKHAWSVLCSKSYLDKDSNDLVLLPLETISIESLPEEDLKTGDSIALATEVVSLWFREPTEVGEVAWDTQIEIAGPDGGKAQGKAVIPVVMSEKYQRMRTRQRSAALPFLGAGTYELVVSFRRMQTDDWTEVARLPLGVTVTSTIDPTMTKGEEATHTE